MVSLLTGIEKSDRGGPDPVKCFSLIAGCTAPAVQPGKGHADFGVRFRAACGRSITILDGKSYRFGASVFCRNPQPRIGAAPGIHFRHSRWTLLNQDAPSMTVGVAPANPYNLVRASLEHRGGRPFPISLQLGEVI
jgi:hypothetical protein